MTNATYYVIYSNTSRNSMAGLRPQVMWTFENTIIEAAAFEMRRGGETLEDMAGVKMIEDADGCFTAERHLTAEEVLSLSIAKLADDGRMYSTFATDAAGAAAFIEAAEDHGKGDEARAIIEKFSA